MKGKEYEILIEKIYKELSPEAEISRNDKILGRDSDVEREIDLSIRSSIAGNQVLILVQAKDHKSKVDIGIVGEFASVIKDVRASKGILICNKGFTKGAIKLAKNQGIDLCSVHDASEKKWRLELKIPILLKYFKKHITLNFRIKANKELLQLNKHKELEFSPSLIDKSFTTNDGTEMKNILELMQDKTMSDFMFVSSGIHSLDLNEKNLRVLFEGTLSEVEILIINIHQNYTYYLKYVDADEYRGVKDYYTGNFKATYLSFGIAIENSPDSSWMIVDNNSLPVNTVLIESDSQLDLRHYAVSRVSIERIGKRFGRDSWFRK